MFGGKSIIVLLLVTSQNNCLQGLMDYVEPRTCDARWQPVKVNYIKLKNGTIVRKKISSSNTNFGYDIPQHRWAFQAITLERYVPKQYIELGIPYDQMLEKLSMAQNRTPQMICNMGGKINHKPPYSIIYVCFSHTNCVLYYFPIVVLTMLFWGTLSGEYYTLGNALR